MDAKTCIQKLKYIASVSMATVDRTGCPQVRTVGIMHVDTEKEELYFLTARGKDFYRELVENKQVQILGLSKYKEMIRLTGVPELIPLAFQKEWLDKLFDENHYMNNVYPGESRNILDVFLIRKGEIEYFNLGVHPIFRESYGVGQGIAKRKGYMISERCTLCGICEKSCPQGAISFKDKFYIRNENCLHCGLCYKNCPVVAIERIEE